MKIEEVPIHILVSPAPNPRMSTLVFETIRTGFPRNPLRVTWKYYLPEEPLMDDLRESVGNIEIEHWIGDLTHWDWIDDIIKHRASGPFILCDTDMIFRKDCTELFRRPADMDVAFAGERVAGHLDVHTGLYMEPKYHTALLYVNGPIVKPYLLRDAGPACDVAYSARPFVLVMGGSEIYYDTLAHLQYRLWCESIDGTGYFDHLHCGTWSQHLKGQFGDWLRGIHEDVLAGRVDAAVIRGKYRQYIQSRR